MGEPVIVEAVRTPIGKRGGHLAGVIAPNLLAVAQQEVLNRVGIAVSYTHLTLPTIYSV